ncbi:MAG: FAD-dependent oxidoreductase [Candidatus Sabulitectum sp.]|nr:FAD-dependent oxidoreductase [Candidatus Sabulitectum sp.]
MEKTVKLTIDQQQVEFEDGTTLLEACKKLDIYIPTLCYHQSLSPYGACRLCLVEVEQRGRVSVQTSCNYPVQEGMVVRTSSERVLKTRKMMVELLLARCPDSSEIQKLASDMGVTGGRIEPKNEDCILCGLCVRICSERMGKGVLGFSNRGSKRLVSPAFDGLSDECQTCGACFSICPMENGIKLEKITGNKPVTIKSEFDEGLVGRSAVYIPYAQAVPNYASIDPRYCVHLKTGECGICAEYCESDAINYDQVEENSDLNVGAVILTTGSEAFDPSPLHEYGYGRYKNVLTSIQFERILAASGPFEGHLQRPSDGAVPTKIAWLQCVGSRTIDSHMPYCSSVCCMYAMKEAIIAREHVDSVEPTIFFMDLRAHGKDFEKYYERAKETGVRFIRSRVSKIREIRATEDLELKYVTEDGTVSTEVFDLVVLSVGLAPGTSNSILSERLDLRLNEYGFIEGSSESPIETTRPGIFVSGPAGAPMDIPETVIQASGSVAGAAEILSEARGTEIKEKEYPPEIDVEGKTPRIGVFVCHCGTNIGSIVDVPAVKEYARNLPNVVYAGENLFTCSQDTQEIIKNIIEENRLNRVVVSSCSPSTHEPLFQETIREAGLNPYLFNMANIRNQCSWVHRDDPAEATRKAKILTRIAVGKARLLKPLHTIALDVIQKALVVGGGLAGMTTALSIADQGFEVALVEREKVLGGNLLRLVRKPDGELVSEYLKEIATRVEDHPGITVYTESTVVAIDGYIGNYLTTIQGPVPEVIPPPEPVPVPDEEETEDADIEAEEEVEVDDGRIDFEHGVIVITTGAEETVPDSYLYGTSEERVITQLELEKDLEKKEKEYSKLKSVVMIQCVGSRDDEHPYCSRVCCTQAVKNAIRLKELNKKMNVYVIYRDIRTYGFNEKYYQQARSIGVIFVRYDTEEKPVVTATEDGVKVTVRDHVLNVPMEIKADKIILASAMKPRDDASILSQMLKIPLNEDGFFMEAHVKLRPVDFSAEGIFLAGLAHSPKTMSETVSQAKAAAERACIIISSDKYLSVANIAHADPNICSGCGMCVAVCPYNAPGLVWKAGKQICTINEALCKGCGSCATVCPSGAMEQHGFSEEQTLEMVNFSLINL